jgi:hypothetical protein
MERKLSQTDKKIDVSEGSILTASTKHPETTGIKKPLIIEVLRIDGDRLVYVEIDKERRVGDIKPNTLLTEEVRQGGNIIFDIREIPVNNRLYGLLSARDQVGAELVDSALGLKNNTASSEPVMAESVRSELLKVKRD